MEFVSRRELEKHTLQRYDKNASEIIDSAPLVAAYIFNNDQEKWLKLNCEGILFLYKKLHDPHFNLFLLNRISNSHLYQPICSTLKLQMEDSYLFFKTDDGTIFGLWIYDKQVYKRISQQIKNMINNVSLKSVCRIPYEYQHQESISRMLRHTEEEYLKSFYNLKQLGIDKEESTIESSSVAKFFEDAGKVIKSTKTTSTSFRFPSFSENTSNRVCNNVIFNPKYNVKCIENSQRYLVMNDICSD